MTKARQEQFKLRLDDVTSPVEFIEIVAEFFATSKEAVLGKARHKELVDVRTIIVKSFIDKWGYTFKFTGTLLNRDHSSIMNLYRRPVKKMWKIPEHPLEGIIEFEDDVDKLGS